MLKQTTQFLEPNRLDRMMAVIVEYGLYAALVVSLLIGQSTHLQWWIPSTPAYSLFCVACSLLLWMQWGVANRRWRKMRWVYLAAAMAISAMTIVMILLIVVRSTQH